MANGKPRRPRLTPNQEAWRREERRIKQILYRMEKAGFKFSREELLPTRPTKITKQSIERLKATTPAILRGYAEVPEGFKGKVETNKAKRRLSYLYSHVGKMKPETPHVVKPATDTLAQTEAATEARKKSAAEKRQVREAEQAQAQHRATDALVVIAANVEAELHSGPYSDVSDLCLEKFRHLLKTAPNVLYNNIMNAPESLIEAAHVVSYASQQEIRVQYGHLFLTLIYGGNIPKSVSKELLSMETFGIGDYDAAWETESGIEMEKQARAGRPTKEVSQKKKEQKAFYDSLGEKAQYAISGEEEALFNEITDFYDSDKWDLRVQKEKVLSKDGLTEYEKQKVVMVNKDTGEVVDYNERLKKLVPRNKKNGENIKVSSVYNQYKRKK